MVRSVAFLILLSLVCTSFALADGPPKRKVYLDVQMVGDAPVGKILIYHLREGLHKSSAFELVMREEDSTMQIRIIMADPDIEKGRWTIYSVAWTVSPPDPEHGMRHFLRQFLGWCGLRRVEVAAAQILAETDNLEADILKGKADYMGKIRTELWKGNLPDFLGMPIPENAVPPAGK